MLRERQSLVISNLQHHFCSDLYRWGLVITVLLADSFVIGEYAAQVRSVSILQFLRVKMQSKRSVVAQFFHAQNRIYVCFLPKIQFEARLIACLLICDRDQIGGFG